MSATNQQLSGRAVVVGLDGPHHHEDGRDVVVLTLTVMTDGEPPFRSRVEAPAIDGLAEGAHLAVLIDRVSRRVELDVVT